MDDQMIVDMFLRRDEDAISETANKYGDTLRKTSLNIVRNMENAEECENDTYLEAWNRIPPHEPRSYFLAFLLKILRHISIDCIRRENADRRKGIVVELSSELEQVLPAEYDVDQIIENRMIIQALNDYLYRMAYEKRVIFVRRYFYFDSIEEISEYCGFSESKIKTILFRCRKDISNYLREEAGYE